MVDMGLCCDPQLLGLGLWVLRNRLSILATYELDGAGWSLGLGACFRWLRLEKTGVAFRWLRGTGGMGRRVFWNMLVCFKAYLIREGYGFFIYVVSTVNQVNHLKT